MYQNKEKLTTKQKRELKENLLIKDMLESGMTVQEVANKIKKSYFYVYGISQLYNISFDYNLSKHRDIDVVKIISKSFELATKDYGNGKYSYIIILNGDNNNVEEYCSKKEYDIINKYIKRRKYLNEKQIKE